MSNKRQRGRAVRPVAPGERRQEAPLAVFNQLEVAVRENIRMIARIKHEEQGRGLLIVQIDDTAEYGLANAQFLGVDEVRAQSQSIPFGDAQELTQAVYTYNPEQAFVALFMDVTPTQAAPSIWFDVVPWTESDAAPEAPETPETPSA